MEGRHFQLLSALHRTSYHRKSLQLRKEVWGLQLILWEQAGKQRIYQYQWTHFTTLQMESLIIGGLAFWLPEANKAKHSDSLFRCGFAFTIKLRVLAALAVIASPV